MIEEEKKESKWPKYLLWILLAIFIIILLYGLGLIVAPTIESWLTSATTVTTIGD